MDVFEMRMYHVVRVPRLNHNSNHYRFQDVDSGRCFNLKKYKTQLKGDINIGDHAVFFLIIGIKTHCVVINDLNYARNYYRKMIRTNENLPVKFNWVGRLTEL